MVSCTITFS
jgi:hypothetical protein